MENTIKRKIKARTVCFITAAMVLTGTITATAVQGSPYELLKDAFFNIMALTNYTDEGTTTTITNGKVTEQTRSKSVRSSDGYVAYFYNDDGSHSGFNYDVNGLSIYASQSALEQLYVDGKQWYSAHVRHIDENERYYSSSDFPDRNSAQARFVELLVDMFVGNLKNNLTVSTQGNIRTVRGTFTETQIPEIIKAGIAMIVEQDSSYYYDHMDTDNREYYADKNPLDTPMKELTINRVQLEVDVNSDGNMVRFDFEIELRILNVFDERHTVSMSVRGTFTDIGTSSPQCPIPGAAQLLTPEFAKKNFGTETLRAVYFSLLDDGSIDPDSVTTTHPNKPAGDDDDKQSPEEAH